MKGSLITSAVLHVLALVMALVTISAPQSFDVADVEALPVDIVPIEEITQIQQGDKKAPVAEKSAPVPTQKPTSVENAENLGNNKVDLKSVPTPNAKPNSAESSAAPEKVEKVQPKQDDVTNDVQDIIKEDTATNPSTEIAKAEPPSEAKPEPAPEAKPEAKPEETAAEEIPLPESVPLPAAKPKPEKPKPAEKPAEKKPAETQTAKAPDKKKADKNQESAKSKSSKESDFNADEIAALLNKNDPTAGGAKASQDKAAFGGKKTTGGSKLSQSEMDALKGVIQNNWSFIPGLAGMEGMVIRVKFRLDESGNLVGDPEVTASGGEASTQQVMMASARRAVLRSAPFTNLPPDKYDAWSEVIVNFDPSEMM